MHTVSRYIVKSAAECSWCGERISSGEVCFNICTTGEDLCESKLHTECYAAWQHGITSIDRAYFSTECPDSQYRRGCCCWKGDPRCTCGMIHDDVDEDVDKPENEEESL